MGRILEHAHTQTLADMLDAWECEPGCRVDPRIYKLERTRSRGVYRTGRLYVVPFVDELGRERRREFETATQARDFRTASESQKGEG